MESYSFGEWLKRRRKQRRLTQREVAEGAHCSVAMIKKIEMDERQPSAELAQLLAEALGVPIEQQPLFIEVARGQRPVDHLKWQETNPGREIAPPRPHPVEIPAMPVGTVTFLMSDIENSTRLWEKSSAAMQTAVARHDLIIKEITWEYEGWIVKTTGDGWHIVFQSAPDAVQAALAIQRKLAREAWPEATGPLKARIALHTGTAEQRDNDYYGPAVNRVAHLMDIGHGGQVLLSPATAALVQRHLPEGAKLTALGAYRLKGMAEPETVYQLSAIDLLAEFPALRAEMSGVSRLPRPATPFIGREREVAEVVALLGREEVRLVTLMGPGGIGKTRLSLEVAERLAQDFDDGVVFVPLAAVSDHAVLPQAVGQALQIPLMGEDGPEAQLQRILRRRYILLVLDNFEQLAEHSVLLSGWLAAAAGLKLLVSSRERLNLVEEWLYTVPGFEEDVAVALFTHAAQRVQPSFETAGEEAAIRQICQLVGGHALAVELSASWVRFMSCRQIADQLRGSLDFLSSGYTAPRNAPERHRTLQDLFDHSWRLLSMKEQGALTKLSVFQGGFMVEEAAEVAGATWPVLLSLADRSLVEIHGDGRYDLHELTRYYATARLAESGQEAATRQAHFESYRRLAQQLFYQSAGPQGVTAYRRLERELDNFRAALSWGLESKQERATLQLTNDLFTFWLRNGYWREAEGWLRKAVDQAGDEESGDLCLVLHQLGTMVALQGRYPEVSSMIQDAWAMARRLGEPWPLVVSLAQQGQALSDREQVFAVFEEAIAICREHEREMPYKSFLSIVFHLYGDRLMDFGLYRKAEAKYRESLAHCQANGEVLHIPYPLGNLGRLAVQDGRLEEAFGLISKSVAYARESGNRVAMADWLFRLGQVHLYRGEATTAENYLLESLVLYEDIGNVPGQANLLASLAEVALVRGDVDQALDRVRTSFALYKGFTQNAFELVDNSRQAQFREIIDDVYRFGLVAMASGDHSRALTIFGAVSAWSVESGIRPTRFIQEKVDAAMAGLQGSLPPKEVEEAYQRGQRMLPQDLLAYILE